MKTRQLHGMAVTELGFGGASLENLYVQTSDLEARLAVDAAWDGGVRYYDTAPHYGLGLSERRLGAALAGRPRADYVLSTPRHLSTQGCSPATGREPMRTLTTGRRRMKSSPGPGRWPGSADGTARACRSPVSLRHPAVTSVVAGMPTAAEVDTALRLLAEPVPEAAWAELTGPS